MVLVFDEERTTHRQGDYKMATDDYENSHPHKGPGSTPYRLKNEPVCPNMWDQGRSPASEPGMAWPVAADDGEEPTPRRKSISGKY